MKSWRIVTVLLLCLVLASSVACNPLGENGEVISQQPVEVVRGDLMVSVSGSGNTEISNEVKLAFGTAGKIAKIYVDEGDRVTKGAVLAELDTGALELAVTQAELALRMAEYNLDQALELYTWPDIKIAQADVDDAEAYYDYVATNLAEATTPEKASLWTSALIYAQAKLAAAEAKLDAMVRSYDTEEVAIEKMKVETANQTLAQAQKQLDEATITAPFAGIVVSVDADEGDSVSTVIKVVHLIDLSSMELEVEVDEIDIADVKLGQKAVIELDALPALQLEGEVSYISLLPEAQGGIITYAVTIDLDAPEVYGVKIGMSATADIIINERSNVLLVPSRAIKQDSQGNDIVEVMVNEEIQQRSVVTGISDGFEIEIIDGLSEGETVIVEIKTKPSGSALF